MYDKIHYNKKKIKKKKKNEAEKGDNEWLCVCKHMCVCERDRERLRDKASHPNDKLTYEERPEGGAAAAAAKLLQSCPTLYNLIDGSPPGSPVPEILKASILEWVAISCSNWRRWRMQKWNSVGCLLKSTEQWFTGFFLWTTYLVLTAALHGGYFYYSHFTGKSIKA